MDFLAISNVTFNSSTDEQSTDWIPPTLKRLTPTGYQVAAAFLTTIAVFGIFNNLCAITVILRNQALRTPLNLMLLNLSASSPLTAAAAFNHEWYLGRRVCIAESFGMYICGIASISSLMVISLERYLLITRPGSFNLTTTMAVLAIAGVWAFSFAIAFPPVVGWSRYLLESPGIACSVDWETLNNNNLSYIIYMFIFVLILPVAVICFCYTNILLTLRKQAHSTTGGRVNKAQTKVTIMIIVMISAFLVAWLPYAVVSLIVLFKRADLITGTAAAAPAIFAKSSIIYNPIIYVFLNPPFRKAFIGLVTCNRGRLPTRNKILGRQVAPSSYQTGHATYEPSSKINGNRTSGPSGPNTPESPPPSAEVLKVFVIEQEKVSVRPVNATDKE